MPYLNWPLELARLFETHPFLIVAITKWEHGSGPWESEILISTSHSATNSPYEFHRKVMSFWYSGFIHLANSQLGH